MIDRESKNPSVSNQLAEALAVWESEGGAPRPASEEDRSKRAVLSEEEEHILRCLGAAIVVQWNDLPTHIQRQLFEHAVSMGETRHMAQLKEQIARFLHNHKDDVRETASHD